MRSVSAASSRKWRDLEPQKHGVRSAGSRVDDSYIGAPHAPQKTEVPVTVAIEIDVTSPLGGWQQFWQRMWQRADVGWARLGPLAALMMRHQRTPADVLVSTWSSPERFARSLARHFERPARDTLTAGHEPGEELGCREGHRRRRQHRPHRSQVAQAASRVHRSHLRRDRIPSSAESQRIGGGGHFFTCGDGVAEDDLSQHIAPVGRSAAIDSAHVRATFSVRIATYVASADHGSATLTIEGPGSPSVVYDSLYTGELTATHGRFVMVSGSLAVPAGGSDSYPFTWTGPASMAATATPISTTSRSSCITSDWTLT